MDKVFICLQKLYKGIQCGCSYLYTFVSLSDDVKDVNAELLTTATSGIPTSVNYHFTRKCNYKCGFCFHTAKTSFVLPLEEAMKGLNMLKEAGKILLQQDCDRCIICHLTTSLLLTTVFFPGSADGSANNL